MLFPFMEFRLIDWSLWLIGTMYFGPAWLQDTYVSMPGYSTLIGKASFGAYPLVHPCNIEFECTMYYTRSLSHTFDWPFCSTIIPFWSYIMCIILHCITSNKVEVGNYTLFIFEVIYVLEIKQNSLQQLERIDF